MKKIWRVFNNNLVSRWWTSDVFLSWIVSPRFATDRNLLNQVLVDEPLPLLGHGHPDVLLLVVATQLQHGKHSQATPSGPGEPDTKLCCEQLHVETLLIDSVSFAAARKYVILCGISAVFEPARHFPTPNIEAQSNEQGRSQGHTAHKYTGEDIDKCAEEAAVFALVEEDTEPVDLRGGDDEHDDTHEDGEVAVGLTGPRHDKLTILGTPLTSRK